MKNSKRIRRRPQVTSHRTAFTLVEMLMTVTVTLLVLLSLVQAFQWIGDRVGQSRAVMEMSGTMRGVGWRLQQDLDNVTVPLRPWPSSDAGSGYFEYVEGPMSDAYHTPWTSLSRKDMTTTPQYNDNTIFGDNDDYLAMTVHSTGDPFVGRGSEPFIDSNGNGVWDSNETYTDLNSNGQYDTYGTVTSYDAEVVWWVGWDDLNNNGFVDNGEYVLRRRVLLIRPDIILPSSSISYSDFFQSYDLSAHPDTLPDSGTAPTRMITNSLADLSQRENRFAHDPRVVSTNSSTLTTPFPYEVLPATLYGLALKDSSGIPTGEDIMLSNVKAFDVRTYDTTAYIMKPANNSTYRVLVPGDLGWTTSLTAAGQGAFVDLAYNTTATSMFSSKPNYPMPLYTSRTWGVPTYDTWSFYYEQDGRDQDGTYQADQATNGIDDDSLNGVDDVGERETAPPYANPMRGLQVKLRMYEPDTRQVRQITVTSDFTPE